MVRCAADQILVLVGLERLHHQLRFDERGECAHESRAAGELMYAPMELTIEIADTFEITRRLAQSLVILIFRELAQLDDAGGSDASRCTRGAV